MSQITTHVLDTARGIPAAGLTISLCQQSGAGWRELGRRHTNAEGRIPDLLDPALRLEPGTYKMMFFTGDYFDREKLPVFYPVVEVFFTVAAPDHYHIPLLLSPFGYSTYRGA
jgi:5-hydroxyisourate hydrolase